MSTHIPVGSQGDGIAVLDKLLHLAVFFVLGMLFWQVLRSWGVAYSKRHGWVLLVLVSYAAADELTQSLVGRDTSIADLLADIVGVLLAVTLMRSSLVQRINQKLRSEDPP